MLTIERILKVEIYIKLLDTISKMDHVAPKEFLINSKRIRVFCCSIDHSSFNSRPWYFQRTKWYILYKYKKNIKFGARNWQVIECPGVNEMI